MFIYFDFEIEVSGNQTGRINSDFFYPTRSVLWKWKPALNMAYMVTHIKLWANEFYVESRHKIQLLVTILFGSPRIST